MNKNKKQSGFAHLAIIIILAVALLGTLGFLYWQNFMQPKVIIDNANLPIDVIIPKTATIETELTEIASDLTRDSGLSIKYPKAWTMEHKGAVDIRPQSGSDADMSTITSPDGAISIFLIVGISGIGGTCDPNDTNYQIAQVDSGIIANYPSQSFISYVTKSISENTYTYSVENISSDTLNELVVGGSPCGDGYSIMKMYFRTNSGSGPISRLYMSLNNVENSKSTTLSEFNKIVTTDNYKIGKRIIQSLYVK